MNPQKFKDWLVKINNATLDKPAHTAALHSLTASIQDLSLQVNDQLNDKEKKMVWLEDEVNKKTTQLLLIENRSKDNWYALLNDIQKQKDKKRTASRKESKQLQEISDMMSRKAKALQSELQDKNRGYLEVLRTELQKLREMRSKTVEAKSSKEKQYQNWLRSSERKADKLIESQEKDLELIGEYERELLSRCDLVEQQYYARLQQAEEASREKQTMLLRKLQVLISEVDIQF